MSRTCDNPLPEHGGLDCAGDAYEMQQCNTHNCTSESHSRSTIIQFTGMGKVNLFNCTDHLSDSGAITLNASYIKNLVYRYGSCDLEAHQAPLHLLGM